jgi:diguanylate cyclase (GGDEF)-like protein/PAS domain S-box-containing protein
MSSVAVETVGSPALFFQAITAIVGFAVFLTGYRLAGRAREASSDGRLGWVFLGSVATGAGLWTTAVLPAVSVAGAQGFAGNRIVSALFVAIAGSLLAFLAGGRDWRPGRSILAGLLTAAASLAVIALALASAEDADARFPDLRVTLLVEVSLAAVATFAHRLAGAQRDDRAEAAAAVLLALATTLSASTLVAAAGISSGAGGGALFPFGVIGPWALASMVGILLFTVVAAGMSTALIHRDAEFASQARLRRLADATIEGIAIVDGNRIVEANETLARLSGRDAERLRDRPFLGWLVNGDGLDDAASASVVREAFLARDGGDQVPVEILARPMDYDGRPHTVYAIRDLSDRRDAELRIRFLADHDTLTGLPNRAAFRRELDQRCAALADGSSFALVCIDLDRFKEANDVFGHRAGDEVLVEVAERLRALLPPGAMAARLGGDEFVAIVRDLPVPHGVGAFAEGVVEALSRPFLHDDQRITIGGSVGVAVAPADGETPDLLLARADMALYRAKNQGRGQSCFFEVAMDDEMRFRRALAFELRDAIDGGALELAYQPLADLSSSGVTGFEALVRWTHPVHGAIAPTIFVAIAEEAGLITRLGDFVLRTACAEAARWEKPLTIAVNLSPLQLEQQSLPDVVHEILLQSGLAPGRLELEVTESALLRNPQRALDVLRRLKALGVRIAMDDFGTGYSSLSTLQSFPFDKLKIDRSFVDRVGTHGQSASIVKAVLGLSRSLDIRVVAEGVENQAQIEFLTGESCDEVQGFMIGMPLPIESYGHLTSGDDAPPVGDDDASAAA